MKATVTPWAAVMCAVLGAPLMLGNEGCEGGSGLPTGNDLIVSDPSASAGGGNAVAIAPNGWPVISYSAYDGAAHTLRVARCQGPDCTQASISVIDSELSGGVDTSIAIGADGLPLIVYSAGGLRAAHCEDPTCSAATVSLLETTAFSVGHLSLAIGSDGLGLISFRDALKGELAVAHCEDVACTAATVSLLADAPAPGRNSVLRIGSDGLGLIGHYDDGQGVRVARCVDIACTAAHFSTIERGRGVFVHGRLGLAMGIDGLPLLAYDHGRPGGLRTAHCADVACSVVDGLSVHPPEATGDGFGASMALGSDGLALIAYHGQAGRLTVTHCADVRCESSVSTPLTDDAYTLSIGIGGDGLGVISYLVNQERVLRVAHCQDVRCTTVSVTTVDDGSTGSAG